MNATSKRVFVQRELFNNRFIFLICESRSVGGLIEESFALPVAMQTLTPELAVLEKAPTFSLPPEAAQGLIDALWECGLRPTEGTGSAGALAAVQRHLEDMRSLVFKKP